MTVQINLRLSDSMLAQVKTMSAKGGFDNIQEYIKETLREKIFGEPEITPEGFELIQKLIKVTNEKNLWLSEKSLRDALRTKTNGVHSSGNTSIRKTSRIVK